VVSALVKVDNCVHCILHLHKCIIEKLMTMVFCASLDDIYTSNKAARKQQAKKISDYINTMAYVIPDDPGNYQVPFDSKTEKMLRYSLMIQEPNFLNCNCRKFFK
jgi:hypothetical protein